MDRCSWPPHPMALLVQTLWVPCSRLFSTKRMDILVRDPLPRLHRLSTQRLQSTLLSVDRRGRKTSLALRWEHRSWRCRQTQGHQTQGHQTRDRHRGNRLFRWPVMCKGIRMRTANAIAADPASTSHCFRDCRVTAVAKAAVQPVVPAAAAT